MVTIMCRGKLQKAIVDGGLPWTTGSRPPDTGPERLGRWAAALVDDGGLVVAVNERTYLTLVVRLLPVGSFRERFVDCLRAALMDLGVCADAVDVECAALRRAPFVRLRCRELADSLDFAQMEAGAHADLGQDDISVRDMLNTYPYAGCDAVHPAEAVSLLFGCTRNTTARGHPGPSPADGRAGGP